ncbi:GL20698 [Drosophila persimilis]|uniref:GL20698 n=1 Tax=Drosophila persimilis TaxID=7234 RepID=B4H4D9_DROPE|nr:GL20698 [Drosophila persimilis]
MLSPLSVPFPFAELQNVPPRTVLPGPGSDGAGQAKPYEPTAQHIVIVTPQAQVHLEPTLRYVHGLSPLARVATPHHEETIVYVPAGAAASVVPVLDAVGSGRAGGLEGKQFEGVQETSNQIQQQVSQGGEIVSGQIGEAAPNRRLRRSRLLPSPLPRGLHIKEELIETPANTQPLIAAEARHFYSLPQVYHTHPVVDVVHGPVYSWPISSIRARSIQQEPEAEPGLKLALTAEPALEGEPQVKAEPEPKAEREVKAESELKKEQEVKAVPFLKSESELKAVPELKAEPELKKETLPVLPLLKEQPLEPQPLAQPQPQPIIAEPQVTKAEFAGRLLESNAIKQELQSAEISKEQIKEEPVKALPEEPLIKAIPAESIQQPTQQQPILQSEPADSIAIANPIVPQA